MGQEENLTRLYYAKLQTQTLYTIGARTVKPFSEALCMRLFKYSEQDNNHLLRIHNFLAEKEIVLEITSEPIIVKGVGEKKKKLGKKQNEADKNTENMLTAQVWINTLHNIETEIQSLIEKINEDNDLIEDIEPYINISLLKPVSEFRCIKLHAIHDELKNALFFMAEEGAKWICDFCGNIEITEDAPDECRCCHEGQSFQILTDWKMA